MNIKIRFKRLTTQLLPKLEMRAKLVLVQVQPTAKFMTRRCTEKVSREKSEKTETQMGRIYLRGGEQRQKKTGLIHS